MAYVYNISSSYFPHKAILFIKTPWRKSAFIINLGFFSPTHMHFFFSPYSWFRYQLWAEIEFSLSSAVNSEDLFNVLSSLHFIYLFHNTFMLPAYQNSPHFLLFRYFNFIYFSLSLYHLSIAKPVVQGGFNIKYYNWLKIKVIIVKPIF